MNVRDRSSYPECSTTKVYLCVANHILQMIEQKKRCGTVTNSAGVAIDAIRCCKLVLGRGLSGAMEAPSAYFMKSPPVQYSDDEARRLLELVINGEEIPLSVPVGETSGS